MLTNESQVRLTINLEGRLAAKAANSNSKKEKKLAILAGFYLLMMVRRIRHGI